MRNSSLILRTKKNKKQSIMSNPKVKIGQKAPSFTSTDQDGKKHKITDYKGQGLVLYFYPKDMTAGCTAQANSLSKGLKKIEKKGYAVVGVSPQGEESHKKFAEKEKIKFPILVDEDHKIAERYGVWVEKNMYGNKYMGVQRSTFIIGPNGKVQDIIGRTKTKEASEQILDRIDKLPSA